MNEFHIPLTSVLLRVFESAGLRVCRSCGAVTTSADALHVHRIFRCRVLRRINAA